MIKVITFDLDDTLWAITPVMVRAEQRLFNWLQLQCPQLLERFSLQALRAMRMELIKSRPELVHQITNARHATLKTAMKRAGLAEEHAEKLADQGMVVFMQARHEVELFDAVEEVIAGLYGRYTLGVLTNGNADIYRLPLGRYFSFSFSAEVLNSSKPMPLHFEKTLQKTGAKPGEIIHVGDHIEHDIAGAQRCGWHTIWVNQTAQASSNSSPPSAIVTSIDELPASISRIEAELQLLQSQ
jgi:putative hydrolase of the HAD superfamily